MKVLAALILLGAMACGPVRIAGPPIAADTVKGDVRLDILEPNRHARYRHTVNVVVSGRPSAFQYDLYLLFVQEGTDWHLQLINPSTQRVFKFNFVPANPSPVTYCVATLYVLKGFDIYGRPAAGKKVAQTYQRFDTNLLTFDLPIDNIGLGGVWAQRY